MSINDLKNIPGNPCIMSDTDSVVLFKALDSRLVGKELGQMKLEYDIKEGIFIRKKCYAIKTRSDDIIIKSSGTNPRNLFYENFIDLLNGKDVETENTTFKVNWKDMLINITKRKIILKGLKEKVKTLFKAQRAQMILI